MFRAVAGTIRFNVKEPRVETSELNKSVMIANLHHQFCWFFSSVIYNSQTDAEPQILGNCFVLHLFLHLNSSNVDELGSWCLKFGAAGKWLSCCEVVSMATLQVASTKGIVTLIQLVDHLQTQITIIYANIWGVREGETFSKASKMVVP